MKFINFSARVHKDQRAVQGIALLVNIVRINRLPPDNLCPAFASVFGKRGKVEEAEASSVNTTFTVAEGEELALMSYSSSLQLSQDVGGEAAGQPSAVRLHVDLLHHSVLHQHCVSEADYSEHEGFRS